MKKITKRRISTAKANSPWNASHKEIMLIDQLRSLDCIVIMRPFMQFCILCCDRIHDPHWAWLVMSIILITIIIITMMVIIPNIVNCWLYPIKSDWLWREYLGQSPFWQNHYPPWTLHVFYYIWIYFMSLHRFRRYAETNMAGDSDRQCTHLIGKTFTFLCSPAKRRLNSISW